MCLQSKATNGEALFLVDKISLLLMVLTVGERSHLNAFVTEENAVPLSLPASSAAPPWLALLSFASSPARLSREGLLAV